MFGKLPFKKKKVVFQAHKGLKTRQDIWGIKSTQKGGLSRKLHLFANADT